MAVNNGFYIGHATVTNFNVVLVENFMELVLIWKVLLDEMEEEFTDICGQAGVVRRVEPNNISFPFLVLGVCCGSVGIIFEFMVVS